MSFSDKVVIVTGASSGIGAVTAIMFAKEGARVALVGRNQERLNKVAQECAAVGAPPLTIKVNIANQQEAGTIIQKTIDHFGKLDVLVNNAGIIKQMSVADPKSLQLYDEIMNTNLRSVVQLTSLAAPHLAATKGNIVNVSAIAGLFSSAPNMMAYSVSKAGMDHFTRCAALDLAPSGVRVNTVSPGPVRTDILENCNMAEVGASDPMWEALSQHNALKRVSDPEEIGDIILFLASNKARGVTGSLYVSDNGSLIYRNMI